jgi:SAM-dependent methyltransferase
MLHLNSPLQQGPKTMRVVRPLRQSHERNNGGNERSAASSATANRSVAASPAAARQVETPTMRRLTTVAGMYEKGSPGRPLRVLHVGCSSPSPARLHGIFRTPAWQEIRLDVDAAQRPDITASIVDMKDWVEDASCDAIWSSHIIEHLARHEVAPALREFRRVLTPTGFALIRCPDIEIVAQFIVEGRIDDVIYTSPAGPITPIDMLYGHGAAIERGNNAMRHGTAFTQDLLGRDLAQAGFAEVRTTRTKTFEVWAAAFMPAADVSGILDNLARLGLDLRG